LHAIGAGQLQSCQRTPWKVHHQSPMVDEFSETPLPLPCRRAALDRLLHAHRPGTGIS
jgi:hypothetical protein